MVLIDCMECTRPIVDQGEGLGKGLPYDVAGFPGFEEFGVQGWHGNGKCVFVRHKLRIEGLQMIKNSLLRFLHLFCTSAGDDDFYKVFWVHKCCVLCQSPTDRLRLSDRCAERPCQGH